MQQIDIVAMISALKLLHQALPVSKCQRAHMWGALQLCSKTGPNDLSPWTCGVEWLIRWSSASSTEEMMITSAKWLTTHIS